MRRAKEIKVGDKVAFDVINTSRGSRVFTKFTGLVKTTFEECSECLKPAHANESCSNIKSDKLVGVFKIVDVSELNNGRKIVFKQGSLQFTYIIWNKKLYSDLTLNTGDVVRVSGWRDQNRISFLRVLEKI